MEAPMKTVLIAAILFVAAPAAQAALPPDLAKAAHDYDTAQMKGDGAELERLLAPDYVLVGSSGAVEDKAHFIADSTGPQNRLDPFTVEQPVEKVWADGAVLGGVARLSGLSGGQPFKVALRFTDVWQKRKGRWVVIYTHASRVAD
jgi:hypothetical protein